MSLTKGFIPNTTVHGAEKIAVKRSSVVVSGAVTHLVHIKVYLDETHYYDFTIFGTPGGSASDLVNTGERIDA